jgi:hypothetical protein
MNEGFSVSIIRLRLEMQVQFFMMLVRLPNSKRI